MPSIRSRIFVFMLKYRYLLKFRLKRTSVVTDETSIKKLREEVERGASFFGKLPEGFTTEKVDIDGLNAEWIIPPGAGKDCAILYFHGGSLVMGSVNAYRGIVAKFVKASSRPALVFDYALAPENPFPKGLNDSLKAYGYLLDTGIEPGRIIFMGDSGGGNLVFSTMLALKDKDISLPAAGITLSAWTDLTNSVESRKTNAELDAFCRKEALNVFSRYYAASNDPVNPLISPLFGDLSELPRLLLFAGGNEMLLSDSADFANKASAAGVDVTLRIGNGLFHCYPVCAPLFPEASDALNEIAGFIKNHI
ncbi:MAG TPA: alpha/beta hydrolase [Desulfomonilia bacterium]